ncbi:hypothetical protein IAD21_00614 [Abditibacteriota bacterium]|nr:hypothetical protein IAD21_00614 [Abditibacteriota bacterium]
MVAPYTDVRSFARPQGRMMLTQERPGPGRKKKKGEVLEDWAIGFAPSVRIVIEEKAEVDDVTGPEWVRRAVEEKLNPVEKANNDGFNTVRLPVFYDAPCGPWSAVLESAERFTINEATADWLEIKDGDAFFQVTGESMLAAGIPHGSLVVIRPYGNKRPSRNDIVFVQILNQYDVWEATIKRLDGWDGEIPRLLDGENKPYSIPETAKKIDVVGRAISQMGVL